MARTVNEIYNAMLADKATRTELSPLTSASQTAIWRVWMYMTATFHHILEVLFDAHKDEVSANLAAQKVHSGKWYQALCLNFQYDAVVPQNIIVNDSYIPVYAVVDATKRIISNATVREANRKLFVKVNKGVAPNLTPLTEPELASFTSYINLMKDAGTQVIVQSLPAEKLTAKFEVDYNPAQGILSADDVMAIIDNFLLNLDYDGVIDVQKLEQSILSDARVKTIKTIVLLATKADDSTLAEFFNLYSGVNLKTYASAAGHIVLNRITSEIFLNAV